MPATDSATDSIRLLEQAVTHHHAGRLAQAQALYREVLDLNPGNADALHLLGVTIWRLGDPVAGMVQIAAALQRNPAHAGALHNLRNAAYDAYGVGIGHQSREQYDEAMTVYQAIVAAVPDYYLAMHQIAMIWAVRGRQDLMREWVGKALAAMRPEGAGAAIRPEGAGA